MTLNVREELKPRIVQKLERFLSLNWWVFLFALLCLTIYEQGQRVTKRDKGLLSKKLEELSAEKEREMQARESMMMQLNSQSDHDWMELTLMKGLGLVPEGYKKVYFSNE